MLAGARPTTSSYRGPHTHVSTVHHSRSLPWSFLSHSSRRHSCIGENSVAQFPASNHPPETRPPEPRRGNCTAAAVDLANQEGGPLALPAAVDEIGLALQAAAQRRERLTAALAGDSMRLVIDCGLPHAVRSPMEFRSLAKQIQTAVGHNRRSAAPVCLQVTSWGGQLASYAEERMGAAAWPLVKQSKSTLELYGPGEIVVLSPDAAAPLTALDERRVYVVGGIVDRSVILGVTAGFAAKHSLESYRLPTLEYADQLGLGQGVSRRPVLNICDVVLALLRFRSNGGDWVDALDAAIPRRKRAGGLRRFSTMQEAVEVASEAAPAGATTASMTAAAPRFADAVGPATTAAVTAAPSLRGALRPPQ
ncbi:hypothetical protein Vretimale_11426 [Volvox reticuliferus]|nr:hypothetical protein Vretifemale_11992 [Volvox reticuliferus]GIM07219.1 hypothetical protein Vretimale_11426 [Volvox reticuliferus]